MSLAMYAAPFNNDSNDYKNSDNDYINNKKKQIHNKTQKRANVDKFDEKKVNNILQKIHDNSTAEEESDLGDFNPPPMPESVGVNKTNATESMQSMNSEKMLKNLGSVPLPTYDEDGDLDLNNFNTNYGDNKTTEEYYKKMIPMYQNQHQNQNQKQNQTNRQYYTNYQNYNYDANNNVEPSSNDILLQKLNYMINLLEEQQDEKTNNVTEEVVLYSFLGIFIIFIVDSFARVGKYTR
jgi:hypothetical protein